MFMSQTTPDTGAVMAKSSNIAIYGGSASSIMFGLTPGEWQILGVFGGLLLGLGGFLINVWFKWQHLKVAKDAASKGYAAPQE
jgi:hypothetical protein